MIYGGDGLDSIDHLIAYDTKIHEHQKYINNLYMNNINQDELLRIQPESSSYNGYRNKYNLSYVGEQILMDGIPNYNYEFNSYGRNIIQPKATGKLGQHYYDGGLKPVLNEDMIQKELENCLFNIKKTMRRNHAKSKGFDILEKEKQENQINNELYDQVVFDDIFDKPNQNYRKVFYADDLNEQEIVINNTGDALNYDNDIDDFRHISYVQEMKIQRNDKKQSILNRLNQQIQINREEEELAERERSFQLEKQQQQQRKGGIMKRKGQAGQSKSKNQKILKFDESSIIDKNDEQSFDNNYNNEFNDDQDNYGLQPNGKVKMSFKEFIDVHQNGNNPVRQTQSAKQLTYPSNNNNNQYNENSNDKGIGQQQSQYDLTDMPKKIPRWRLQSEAIRATMKTNPGFSREESQSIVSALNKTELIYCEYCKRKFKPGPAESHIPLCKDKFQEKQRLFALQSKKKITIKPSKYD